MHEELRIEESEEFIYQSNHRFAHERLAQMIIEQFIECKDKGIRLKHPIQLIANLVYGKSKYNCKAYMAGLIHGLSNDLAKYYSYQELDVLRLSLENAQADVIDERYIEIVSNS